MKHNILLIDNDPQFAAGLGSACKDSDLEFIHTDNSSSGLMMARSVLPSAIVLSIELPDTSGFSVCQKIHRDKRLKPIPLFVVSKEATDLTFEKHKQLATRADEYFRKPTSPIDLVETAMGYLTKSREEVLDELSSIEVPKTKAKTKRSSQLPRILIWSSVLVASATAIWLFLGQHF